jgi:hypothetical protein
MGISCTCRIYIDHPKGLKSVVTIIPQYFRPTLRLLIFPQNCFRLQYISNCSLLCASFKPKKTFFRIRPLSTLGRQGKTTQGNFFPHESSVDKTANNLELGKVSDFFEAPYGTYARLTTRTNVLESFAKIDLRNATHSSEEGNKRASFSDVF